MVELAGYFSTINCFDIHLILYASKREKFYKVPDRIIIHEPKIDFTDKSRLYYLLYTINFLRRQVKKIDPHSILSFGEGWNNFVMLALFGINNPVFLSDRCKPDKKLGFLHGTLRKWLYPRARGIIAQTELAKKLYEKQFRHSNISVVGNPIRKVAVSSSHITKDNIVLSVGRFIPSKHFNLLIDIFLDINMSGWKLLIIGDNSLGFKLKDDLLKMIHERNAEDKIILSGTLSNVDEFYLKSKVFAFTSSSEGFPNVIGEAMSAGLPVIAFDCIAGPSEMIIDDKTGYLIPLNNKQEFKRKLHLLMLDESLRSTMGQHGMKTIEEFSIDSIGKKYISCMIN